jgi:hypothetical protein
LKWRWMGCVDTVSGTRGIRRENVGPGNVVIVNFWRVGIIGD